VLGKEKLTVGKYPSVKTLSKEVLPQAPSPIMTSFLEKGSSVLVSQFHWRGKSLKCGVVSKTIYRFQDVEGDQCVGEALLLDRPWCTTLREEDGIEFVEVLVFVYANSTAPVGKHVASDIPPNNITWVCIRHIDQPQGPKKRESRSRSTRYRKTSGPVV
jgi:hypothetical protein